MTTPPASVERALLPCPFCGSPAELEHDGAQVERMARAMHERIEPDTVGAPAWCNLSDEMRAVYAAMLKAAIAALTEGGNE